MPTVTLAESAKLTNDMLLSGVIDSVRTVDRFYDVLPFRSIEGNALAYNREGLTDPATQDALVRFYSADSMQTEPFSHADDGVIGGEAPTNGITSKSATTFQRITSTLTTIIGDAEVNGLINVTRSDFSDQTGVQVAAKAKAAGRRYRNTLINGDGTGDTFVGLTNLVPAGQTIPIDAGAGGGLAFTDLDALLDAVIDKDGEVDYIIMHSAALRNYMTLLRGLGGAAIGETVTLPSGTTVPSYRSVPIFRNDYVPTNLGVSTDETLIFAGTLDDGSGTTGISGLTAQGAAGIQVEDVGIHQYKDERITRVKWYCGLALYSELGIAMLTGHAPSAGAA